MTNHLYDQLIAPQAANNSCFLALDEPGTPKNELSFATFAERASQCANMLVAHGVQPGDRVAVQAPKRSEVLALYVATLQAGAVFLPMNTGYKRDELTYFLEDATPRMVVCQDCGVPDLEPVARRIDATILTLNADGTGSLFKAIAGRPGRFNTVSRGAG